MKKKLVIVMCTILLSGLISRMAFDLGLEQAVTVQAAKEDTTEKKEKDIVNPVEIQLPVAIVNLDEGVEQSDGKTNYGADLIELIQEDIKVTGLEDARQGIETGRYSAYVIIPNTFSAQVVTVNAQPVKSQLTYAIASDLVLTERENVLGTVVSIYNTMTNSLSKVYTASLLKEYHTGQDNAIEVMERDQLDLEKLMEINGYDLVELIEIPQLETVERDLQTLDLSDNYAANSDGLENINIAYKGYIQTGTESLGAILGQTAVVGEKKIKTGEDIQVASDDINQISFLEIDDEQRTQNEDQTFSESKEKINGQVGIISTYSGTVDAFNKEVFNKSVQYDQVETSYRQFLSNLDSALGSNESPVDIEVETAEGSATLPGVEKNYTFHAAGEVATAAESYEQNLRAAYEQKLQEIVQNAQVRFGTYLDTTMGETMDGVLLGKDVSQSYGDYVVNNLAGIDFSTPAAHEVSAAVLQGDVTAPQITVDGTNYTQVPALNTAEIGTEIDKIVQVATDGRTARNTEYNALTTTAKADVEDAKSKVANVTASYEDENVSHQQLLGDLSGFDMGSYIQDGEISQYAQELSANHQDISDKVMRNNESYELYTQNVYEATNTNITSLQKSIFDGQEASNNRLEETLSGVKTSKENTTRENIDALQDFSSRLSYTRLGDLENQTVYDFIVEPLLLKNLSKGISPEQRAAIGQIETKSSDMGVTQPVKDLVNTAKTNKGLSWAMAAVISLLVLAVVFLGALKIVNSRRKEHF